MERRLSVILATDMVGYSALMEADETETLERQKDHRRSVIDPAFQEFHGRIVKEMGDGLLAEFSSVFEAVQCAVKIQRAVPILESELPSKQKIVYRIGINSGDIIVDADDIFGDGINVAKRLEQLAEPGGICISGAAFDQLRSRIDVGFEPLGDVSVKNIGRPIRAYKVVLDYDAEGPRIVSRHAPRVWRRRGFAGAALLALAIISGVLWWSIALPYDELDSSKASIVGTPDIPSIAVLAFDNIGEDPRQDYFVDGITSDLITDLAKLSGLMVISRNSSFSFTDKTVTADQIATDLGVRYILEGSIQKSKDRLRINTQLIDTQTGRQIWADRFDRTLGEALALQDDITRKIVDALKIELKSDEVSAQNDAAKQVSPEAYDLYLQGFHELRQFTPESIRQARILFLKSLLIAPDFAVAHAAVAFSYSASSLFFVTEYDPEIGLQALLYASRALELDERLPQGHFSVAMAHLRQGNYSEAMTAAEKSILYNPSYADGYAALAAVLSYRGDGQRAEDQIRFAMTLNPAYSATYLEILGRSLLVQEDNVLAEQQFSKCLNRDPSNLSCHVFLAAIYGLNEDTAASQWEVEEILSLDPDFNLANNPFVDQFERKQDREMIRRGLAQAGVPED